ncbi:hypothetical protein OEZ85_003685 [Tetradesmus obliquus]|uniref:AB hydrolase-1 domain-containing protein n=1 Tax=Tetradesmus obliquus TaxID=3088 RepID=A0ABY8UD95_TETOB|nr:hypothetical protein OEZ85_003685 [Tetradesmus obliquus]
MAAARKPFCAVVDQVPAWAYNTPWREDLVSYAGGKTWYRFVNYLPPPSGFINKLTRNLASNIAQDKAPLLVLAGGPGLPVSYLEPLELMAGVGRQVIFYDQVGCGNTFLASNSTCPPADQLTLDLYLRQIDALREALGLEKVHLYGQGVLAGWDAQGLGLSSLQETPVLVTRGEFDEVSHASAQQLAGLLPNCQMAEFAGAGSYQHIDAWEPHLTRIELHLCAAEGSPIPKTA